MEKILFLNGCNVLVGEIEQIFLFNQQNESFFFYNIS